MGDLSAHFSTHEFVCRDGTYHAIDPALIAMLEEIRAHFRAPISITSGYRSPAWNAAVGGARRSYHVTGQAADFTVQGVRPADVYAWCDLRFPTAGVGLYRSWVHIDSRGRRARWGAPAKRAAATGFAAELAREGAVVSTKWAIARALAEVSVRWGWRALRDWRVSPEELLDLADVLLRYARDRRLEAGEDGNLGRRIDDGILE